MKSGEPKGTLAALLEQVKRMPPMSEREQTLQALDFAYGNLACTTNHKPSRSAFRIQWLARGLPPDEFDAWADVRYWRKEEKGDPQGDPSSEKKTAG